MQSSLVKMFRQPSRLSIQSLMHIEVVSSLYMTAVEAEDKKRLD
jgi:hypothetical protein